ncbi:MAG: alpha/beta hydrolase [Heteroscytonema crispum UTEX LB 1556]
MMLGVGSLTVVYSYENRCKNPGEGIEGKPSARNVLGGAQAGAVVDKLPVDIEDRVIPSSSNDEISIRIVRPQGNTDTLPVVVYFYGGWVLGDKDTHDRLIREIANGAKAAVIFVNYTPSPEARYPVAIEQAYAATKWVAENSTAINVDSSRLAVVGDSPRIFYNS